MIKVIFCNKFFAIFNMLININLTINLYIIYYIFICDFNSGGLRLDTNRLNTSHSQRLNSGKPLGTGRCGWWCPIDPCPNVSLPFNSNPVYNCVIM